MKKLIQGVLAGMLVLCTGCANNEAVIQSVRQLEKHNTPHELPEQTSDSVPASAAKTPEPVKEETPAEVYEKMFEAMHETANYTVDFEEQVNVGDLEEEGEECYRRKYICWFENAPVVSYSSDAFTTEIKARIDSYININEGDEHTELTFYLVDGICYLDLADDRSGQLIQVPMWQESVLSDLITMLDYTPSDLEDHVSFPEQGNSRRIRVDIENGLDLPPDMDTEQYECYQIITLNDAYLPERIDFRVVLEDTEGFYINDTATLLYSDWGTTDIHWDTVKDFTDEAGIDWSSVMEDENESE